MCSVYCSCYLTHFVPDCQKLAINGLKLANFLNTDIACEDEFQFVDWVNECFRLSYISILSKNIISKKS